MYQVILKSGREKSLRRRHPWVFSGAIKRVEGYPETGETVKICDVYGNFLAYGAYSPESQIRIRIWTWNEKEKVNQDYFRNRLKKAIAMRESSFDINRDGLKEDLPDLSENVSLANAIRLVHAESDFLPGLIVDRYGDVLVMQVLSAGIERWRELIADLLQEITQFKNIYERSDVEVRELEGYKPRIGSVRGNPPEEIIIEENSLRYLVSLKMGHKTGFYLDQRLNRLYLRGISQGKNVLDCFSYTGGFSLNALKGGAKSVVAVESSPGAQNFVKENLKLNNLTENNIRWLVADVFDQLRKFRDRNIKFDLIILDPPKFAPTLSHVSKASRGYKDINLLAFKLLRPGGFLVTFSCSGGLNPSLFQKIVADAALDAGVKAKIIRRLHQSPDHPVALNFPEGAYLKGLSIMIE
jgi:23S rRNA (cytosine1962-C5)-methyltransferase